MKRHYRSGLQRNAKGCSSMLLQEAKRRAKKHNAECTLTHKWILDKLLKGKCEVTNLDFVFACKGRKMQSSFAPSIDRIDNSNRNYTPENCRIVCLQVNIARSNYDKKTILTVLEALVPALERQVSGGGNIPNGSI